MAEARELSEHERDPRAGLRAQDSKGSRRSATGSKRAQAPLVPRINRRQGRHHRDPPGTGGDEAGLFAADLFKMYSRYAESHRWKVDLLRERDRARCFKEVVFEFAVGRLLAAEIRDGVHRCNASPNRGQVASTLDGTCVMPEAEEVTSPSTRAAQG